MCETTPSDKEVPCPPPPGGQGNRARWLKPRPECDRCDRNVPAVYYAPDCPSCGPNVPMCLSCYKARHY